jgi:hypothetical protein
MKKAIYFLFLPLIIVSIVVFANHKSNSTAKSNPKPLTAAESKAALKKWESSPEGVFFKKWEASPAGLKVQAAAAKINKLAKDHACMEAVVTSLSLPEGAQLGFGFMVNINGEAYILSFGPEMNKEFTELHRLQVNDKILVKTNGVSKAPKYAYPIVSGDYVERDGKILYKKALNKGGC